MAGHGAPLIVCAVSVGIVLAWIALPGPLGIGVFQSQPTGHSPSVLGPYTLNSTNYYAPVELSFPPCSVVTLDWAVTTGGPTNFTVDSGEEVTASNCHGPGPTNESCLPLGCSANGPPPVCFETGMGGSCSFTATQPQYAILIFQVLTSTSYGPAPTNESVTVTADYS